MHMHMFLIVIVFFVWTLCILHRFLDCWLFCTAEQIRLLRERLELTGDFSVVCVVFCSITLEFGICKHTWKWETEWLLVALADESTQISENLASPIFWMQWSSGERVWLVITLVILSKMRMYCMSQLYSGNVPNCTVYDPRSESYLR